MNLFTIIMQWLMGEGSSAGGESESGSRQGSRNERKHDVEGLSYINYNASGLVPPTQIGDGEVSCTSNELCDNSARSGRGVSVTPSGDALIIRNGEKAYRSGVPVLNGLNMTVPCGSIYGLLGSSGSGKTTILSCIVGLQKLDKGNIWIFGKKPGKSSIGVPGRNVGYMPQDISLYGEFTIKETLNYFGKLNGMKKNGIRGARKLLISLLSLPRGSARVGSLSGGQQRRVSLIVALLGRPELLILDEPTVGVDPVIRQNIWLHLKKLVQSHRTTVIITTHYIEECREANNVGILRNGRLLEEKETGRLMTEHGTNNLEKIILDLSRREESTNCIQTRDENKPEVKTPTNMAKILRKPNYGLKDSLGRIRALIRKNYVIMSRNPLLLFFNILCAACVAYVGLVSQGLEPNDINIGLVNKEVSLCPVANMTPPYQECRMDMLSCRFLSYLNKDVFLLEAHHAESSALAAVHAGTSWGYITFPSNFSAALFDRMESGKNPGDDVINESEFTVRLDNTNAVISMTVQFNLYTAFEKFGRELMDDCGFDKRQVESPLKFREPIYGNDETTFREFMGPGMGLILVYFFPVIMTGIRYVREKQNGILHRSIVNGVEMWEIMIAYSISELPVILLQSCAAFFVFIEIFHIAVHGSTTLAYFLSVLSGYAGMSMGFLLGLLCTNEIQVAMLTMAAYVPNVLLSGVLWPLEGIVVQLQDVVQAMPCTLGAEAVRSIVSRAWEFSHPNVWPGFAVIIAYVVGFFILNVIISFRFKA